MGLDRLPSDSWRFSAARATEPQHFWSSAECPEFAAVDVDLRSGQELASASEKKLKQVITRTLRKMEQTGPTVRLRASQALKDFACVWAALPEG